MIAGFKSDNTPQLFLTDPAGTFSEWKANAIGGRNEKAVKEFLEKNWTADLNEANSIELAIKSLMEVVDSGSKNMDIAVIRNNQPMEIIPEADLSAIIADIEKEQEEAKAKANVQTNI
jgi:20S proteasome subunit alpha 4